MYANPKRLAQGQLPATATTLYTAPSTTAFVPAPKTVNVCIVLANTDTAARTYTLHHIISGASAVAANMIADAVSLPANTTDVWEVEFVMESGDFIQGLADVASKITYTISGVEVT